MTITQKMRQIVAKHPLGFVGTVNADGTPNVSPKGTMVILDDNTIIFGEIRSPQTLENIARSPAMEINFIDIFARRAFRAKGTATALARDTKGFADLYDHFSYWGDLAKRIRHIVRLNVTDAQLISSPAYDIGQTEEELTAHWKAHFAKTG